MIPGGDWVCEVSESICDVWGQSNQEKGSWSPVVKQDLYFERAEPLTLSPPTKM